MASKLLLDANVILEYFLKRTRSDDVRQLFHTIENGINKAFTSTSIFQTCGYVLLKTYGKDATRKVMLALLNDVTVIDCKHDTIVFALNSIIPDIEDAIQYYSAIQHNMDFYLTFDKELIKYSTSKLPIQTPAQFLNS